MNPIFTRIMSGESICPSEINQHNAGRIMEWVRDTDSHHTKDECTRGKDCVHAPGQSTVDWAAALVSESAYICVCGEHGVDDYVSAKDAIRTYRDKWSQENKRAPRVKR